MEAIGGATSTSRARRVWVVGLAAAGVAAAGLAFALVRADTEQFAGGAAPTQPGGRPTVGAPPTAGPPSGGGAGSGELGGSEIDHVIDRLPTVNAAFNAPSTLRLEESAVIQLRLSGRRSIRRLQEEITALGRREGARIKASDEMEANLAGTGFKIEAITPTAQSVSRAGVTQWKWEVEPTKTGIRRLHLSLSAILHLEGKESLYTVRTFERTLEVRVPLRERLSGFVGRNWQWLWTALLLPVGGWMLSRRRRTSGA
jgi:hypothetical protein